MLPVFKKTKKNGGEMNFFKRLKKGIQHGTEKAAEIVDEGLEKIKTNDVDVAALGRQQHHVADLEINIDQKYKDLGRSVYEKSHNNMLDNLWDALEPPIEHLRQAHSELENEQKVLNSIYKTYQKQSVSKTKLKTFKDELEAAGCAIEYLVVVDDSPYLGLTLSEIDLPEDLLLGMIIRDGQAIIPTGTTEIKVNDNIMLMGKKQAVLSTLYQFDPTTELELIDN